MTNSELETALLAEAPTQWTQFLKQAKKMDKTKSKSQKQIKADVEEIRRRYIEDPALSDVENKVLQKTGSALLCPRCGAEDRGNRMNGKPWCFKCNKPFDEKPGGARVLGKRESLKRDFESLMGGP